MGLELDLNESAGLQQARGKREMAARRRLRAGDMQELQLEGQVFQGRVYHL